MPNNKKKLWILLGALVVIVIIIIVVTSQSKKTTSPTSTNEPTGTEQTGTTPGATTPEGKATGTVETKVEAPVDLKTARVEIPGASLVTKDNRVVTPEGKVAKNDVIPASAEAPKSVLIAKDQLPKTAVNVEISGGAFKPSSFTVKPNAPVNFAITSTDGLTHVVIFSNAVLGAIAMGIGPNETKAITFNAPATPGEYEFRCDVPGHRGSGAGELGKMIVK